MLTIVFDLDGTLIDTAPDLIDTLNFILARQGLPVVPYDAARPMIGGGARGMIERALAPDGRSAAAAEVERLYASFVDHYARAHRRPLAAVSGLGARARPPGGGWPSARGMHQQA